MIDHRWHLATTYSSHGKVYLIDVQRLVGTWLWRWKIRRENGDPVASPYGLRRLRICRYQTAAIAAAKHYAQFEIDQPPYPS
jgi:hypothetical protein